MLDHTECIDIVLHDNCVFKIYEETKAEESLVIKKNSENKSYVRRIKS
jgi:hypothetical protein